MRLKHEADIYSLPLSRINFTKSIGGMIKAILHAAIDPVRDLKIKYNVIKNKTNKNRIFNYFISKFSFFLSEKYLEMREPNSTSGSELVKKFLYKHTGVTTYCRNIFPSTLEKRYTFALLFQISRQHFGSIGHHLVAKETIKFEKFKPFQIQSFL